MLPSIHDISFKTKFSGKNRNKRSALKTFTLLVSHFSLQYNANFKAVQPTIVKKGTILLNTVDEFRLLEHDFLHVFYRCCIYLFIYFCILPLEQPRKLYMT